MQTTSSPPSFSFHPFDTILIVLTCGVISTNNLIILEIFTADETVLAFTILTFVLSILFLSVFLALGFKSDQRWRLLFFLSALALYLISWVLVEFVKVAPRIRGKHTVEGWIVALSLIAFILGCCASVPTSERSSKEKRSVA